MDWQRTGRNRFLPLMLVCAAQPSNQPPGFSCISLMLHTFSFHYPLELEHNDVRMCSVPKSHETNMQAEKDKNRGYFTTHSFTVHMQYVWNNLRKYPGIYIYSTVCWNCDIMWHNVCTHCRQTVCYWNHPCAGVMALGHYYTRVLDKYTFRYVSSRWGCTWLESHYSEAKASELCLFLPTCMHITQEGDQGLHPPPHP